MKAANRALNEWPRLCLALLLAQAGCTVNAVSGEEDARPRNSCTNPDSCGSGESCLGGLCQSLNGKLEAVLLTATPAVESDVTQLTFVAELSEFQTTGALDVVWPGAAEVTGSLVLPVGHCYPEFISEDPKRAILASTDGTLPVTVTLSLRQRLLGLGQQTYYGKTVDAPVMGYTFGLKVPSGEYDVYLVPPKRQKGSCVVPPQLFRSVPIGVMDNSAPNGVYRFNLAAVSELNLHLLWPVSSRSLVGWSADIIEPLGGNPISTEVVLGGPKERSGKLDFAIPLAYSAVTERAAASGTGVARDLLRLRPPSGTVAPTIYLERSVLGLLQGQSEQVDLTVFTRFPQAVTVRGRMSRLEDGRSVAGTLSLVSKKIYGVDDGVFGSFQTSATVGADGLLEVSVPPGKYAVRAVPDVIAFGGDNLSVLEAEWEVPEDVPLQFGKLLELTKTSKVTGQSRVQGAQVQANPAPTNVLPFQEAFGEGPLVARSTGGVVDDAGRFVLQVDDLSESRVNLTVLIPEELGFAWFVRPGLEIGRGDQELGRVSLPLPAVLAGRASVLEGGRNVALASALIRAYAYLDKDFRYTRDPGVAETVVQVAQTRADQQGAFRLLLPESIDAPKQDR
jgi:hypothetical protein